MTTAQPRVAPVLLGEALPHAARAEMEATSPESEPRRRSLLRRFVWTDREIGYFQVEKHAWHQNTGTCQCR